MTNHTIKAQKISANIKKSKAAGEATKAAKEAAAGEQKRRALESGGRFQEGGVITTVTKATNERGGRDFHVGLSERLSFRDKAEGAKVTTRRIKDSVSTSDRTDTRTKTKAPEPKVSSSSDFIGPVQPASEKVISQPKQDRNKERVESLLGLNISFDRILEDPNVKQSLETLENFGREFLLGPELLGSAPTKPAQELRQIVESGRKETSLSLLSEGKVKEAFEKPGFKGSILALAAVAAAPVGPKVVQSERILAAAASREKQLTGLEKTLQLEKGAFQKLPEGSKGPTGSGLEKFITTGGTEKKPSSIFVAKFGKGGDTLAEITPSTKPTASPEGAKIAGKLGPIQQKGLEAEKEFAFSDFRFKTDLVGSKPKSVFNIGVTEKEISQFGTKKETAISNILKGKPEKIKADIDKPGSVFAQTKAEKLESIVLEERFPSIGPKESKVFKPFSAPAEGVPGAGASGKAKVFTKTEEKIIREFETPKQQVTQKKQPLESLFTAPISPQQSKQQSKTEVTLATVPLVKPPAEKDKPGLSTIVIPKQTTGLDSLVGPGPEGLKITESVDLVLTPGLKPKESFIFKDKVTTKLVTGQSSIGPPPPFQPPTVPTLPPEEPVKIRPLAVIAPPISSRDFDTPSERLGKTKGFFGNVPLDDVRGIVSKAPTITISEGKGFSIKSFLKKTSKSSDLGILGDSKASINIFDSKPRRKKGKKSKSNDLGILGSSEGSSLTIFSKSKGSLKL